jgi:hypothetical protein
LEGRVNRGGIVVLALSGWVVWVHTLDPRTTAKLSWDIESSHATYEECIGYLKDRRTRAEKQRSAQLDIHERPGVLRVDDKKIGTVVTAYCLPGTLDPREKRER